MPYVCIWLAVQGAFRAFPSLSQATGLERFGWMAVAFAGASILVYFGALMCTHLAAFHTARNMRRTAIDHAVDLPLGFFSSNQTGRLRKIIDDNAGMTETLLAHELPDLVGAIVTPVVALVLLFVFDWRMGLVCLIPMIVSIWLMTLMMGGKNAKFFERYQIQLENMSSEAVEYIRGIPVVKVFQQTVHSFKNFYQAIMSYKETGLRLCDELPDPLGLVYHGFKPAPSFCLSLWGMLMTCCTGGDGWDVLLNMTFLYPLCCRPVVA